MYDQSKFKAFRKLPCTCFVCHYNTYIMLNNAINASIDYEYKRTFNQLYVEKNQTLPLIFNRYMIRKCFVYHERASFDHSYDVNSYCKCEK